MMSKALRLGWLILILILTLIACSKQAESFSQEQTESFGQEQAVDAAWEALDPNTSSHDRANWEVAEARQVTGSDVMGDFDDRPAPGCMGPPPPDNQEIDPDGDYWYVHFERRPATPIPGPELSPTAPPNVPEPFMYQALFLIDPADGGIIARKLYCVIY
jgi:hypothetical protein